MSLFLPAPIWPWMLTKTVPRGAPICRRLAGVLNSVGAFCRSIVDENFLLLGSVTMEFCVCEATRGCP